MSDLAGTRILVQAESVVTRKPLSENLMQTLGQSANFTMVKHTPSEEWKVCGQYSGNFNLDVDTLFICPWDGEIVNVALKSNIPGSGGVSEMDILRITTPGGTPTSIFLTTPKALPTQATYSWIETGGTVTGMVAPVLTSSPSPYQFNAGDALLCRLVSSMTMAAKDISIQIFYRPR